MAYSTYQPQKQDQKKPFDWKKWLIIAATIVVGIIIIIIVTIFVRNYRFEHAPSFYSYEPYDPDNASTWIGTYETNKSLVDVEVATEYKSLARVAGQEMVDRKNNISTIFTTYGNYFGNIFDYVYFDGDVKRMTIYPDIIPGDNILNAYAFERMEDGKLMVYFFFDQEWKDQYGDRTYIYYGKDLNQSRRFVFNKAREGIYYDAVEDDLSRIGPVTRPGPIAGAFNVFPNESVMESSIFIAIT